MKEYVKAYNMFLAGRYMRYIIYLLMPVVLLMDCSAIILIPATATIKISLASVYVFWGEAMLEGWSFRGIAKKKNYNLEYLKTSAKWKKLLYKGLVFDSIRKFLSTSVILTAAFLMLRMTGEKKGEGITAVSLLVYIFFTCFCCTLFLGIIRRTENVYVSLFVVYFTCIPLLAGNGIVASCMSNIAGVVLCAALYAAAVVFNINNIVNRIGGSFYDE